MRRFAEFRQDLISGDWILVTLSRSKRPFFYKKSVKRLKPFPKSQCPFENPQKSGNSDPLLWYPSPRKLKMGLRSRKLKSGGFHSQDFEKDWFIQVFTNKYSSVASHGAACPSVTRIGPYQVISGQGFNEVFVTRPHERSFAQFNADETTLVLRAYQQRYSTLSKDRCVKYISIFHNHGFEAGASVPHPHSQLIAIPIVPPDIARSIQGSKKYFHKNKRCGHCTMVAWEKDYKKRVIFSNGEFVAIAPFASRISSEIRIYPLKHESNFEYMDSSDLPFLAEVLNVVLAKLYKGMKDIAFNMFIHTAPVRARHVEHYHWHIEILPKTSTWAGWELGTGLEIVAVSPEETAKFLRGVSL